MPSTRVHHPRGLSWNLPNISVTLLLALFFLVFLFLYMLLTAQPAQAQNAVPPTARQAATMPQFASRLHPSPQTALRPGHPYPPQASYRTPADRRGHGWLPDDIVYTNGPINGTTDAWTINFGFITANTFTVGGSDLGGLTFGAWLAPGDVLQSVEVSITSDPFGGTTYFDSVVSFTQSDCIGNQYGYNVCTATGSFTLANLNQGTYWLNLQNAQVNTGDPVYWDENSGPSMAMQNGTGTIPSEAFTVEGATCYFDCPPECVHDVPADNFKIIHSFTGNEQSPAPGLAIDQAENLYGTSSGGNNGLGLAYKLALHGQDWMSSPLYSFMGGTNGQAPGSEIVGPGGALYGTADGGIQNCGWGVQYCGMIYRLRPSPFACLTALCSWTEEVIYRFTGTPDAGKPNSNLVFDGEGNLYGTAYTGGAYGGGAVYELTPSGSSWTEKVIYSFTGGSDGVGPYSLLLGQDGNLHGTAMSLAGGGGVIFQLVPSGGSWTEVTIASYGGCSDPNGGWCYPVLIQEHSGNFYGSLQYSKQECNWYQCWWGDFGVIFTMSRHNSTWEFGTVYDIYLDSFGGDFLDEVRDTFHDLAIDTAGNLYATEGGSFGSYQPSYGGSVWKLPQPHQQQTLVGFGGDDFRDLKVGASGKLYGTTGPCRSSYGTVWQLTP